MENINILKLVKPKSKLDLRNPVAYSPHNLYAQYTVDFDVKLSNGKDLQRPYVWNLKQKQDLILAILREVIIPPIYVVMNTDKNYIKVVDGKQRVSTIFDFMDNKFPIIIDNVEYYFSNFDDLSKYRLIHSFSFNTIIHYEYDDDLLSDNDLITLFEMVNFSGTQQDINHINNLKNI